MQPAYHEKPAKLKKSKIRADLEGTSIIYIIEYGNRKKIEENQKLNTTKQTSKKNLNHPKTLQNHQNVPKFPKKSFKKIK